MCPGLIFIYSLFSFSAGLVSFPVSMFHNIATFKTTDINNQGNYRVASVNQHHHNGELSHQTLNDNHLSIGHADSSGVTMEVMAVDQSWLGLKRRDLTLSVIWIHLVLLFLLLLSLDAVNQSNSFTWFIFLIFFFFFFSSCSFCHHRLWGWAGLGGEGVVNVCMYIDSFLPYLLMTFTKSRHYNKMRQFSLALFSQLFISPCFMWQIQFYLKLLRIVFIYSCLFILI